jgi:hypothetical protein
MHGDLPAAKDVPGYLLAFPADAIGNIKLPKLPRDSLIDSSFGATVTGIGDRASGPGCEFPDGDCDPNHLPPWRVASCGDAGVDRKGFCNSPCNLQRLSGHLLFDATNRMI